MQDRLLQLIFALPLEKLRFSGFGQWRPHLVGFLSLFCLFQCLFKKCFVTKHTIYHLNDF